MKNSNPKEIKVSVNQLKNVKKKQGQPPKYIIPILDSTYVCAVVGTSIQTSTNINFNLKFT